MRSSYILLAFSLIFTAAAQEDGEGEDYLGVIEPSGFIAGANYSEYGSAFEELMAGPPEQNLSSYPDYLVEFLEEERELPSANYSLYSPAFEEFMNLSNRSSLNLSSYPEYLVQYLNRSPDALRADYALRPPTFEEFMNLSNRSSLDPSSYPRYLRWFLGR